MESGYKEDKAYTFGAVPGIKFREISEDEWTDTPSEKRTIVYHGTWEEEDRFFVETKYAPGFRPAGGNEGWLEENIRKQ